jgi:subtilisin family serine protease
VIVSEKEDDNKGSADSAVTPADFGAAVRWAVEAKARVMNLSLAYKTDYPEVREAIRYAVAHDVVVVAAVGNYGADGNPTTYPAAYEDVLGVGAIDQTGVVLKESGRGTFVDLVAPGGAVVAAGRERGHVAWTGTSFAAPFVAATAALVRQYYPQLTAKQVATRLLATASPAAGGPKQYGRGVVDPYRAVTAQLASPSPTVRPTPVVRGVDPAAVEREYEAGRVRRASLLVGTGAGAVTLIVFGIMVVRRWGRRQGWTPTRADPVVPADDDPDGAPVRLFDERP